MLEILKPLPKDAEGMNEVIKRAWYATYTTPEIGVTKEDIDEMYAQNETQQIEVFKKRADNPKDNDITLIAKEDERVVGIVRVLILEDHTRVRTLYVHPEYFGQGIGTALWRNVLEMIPTNKPVIAYPAEHTKSIDWYKKMGFKETGEKNTDEEETYPSGAKLVGVKMIFKIPQ